MLGSLFWGNVSMSSAARSEMKREQRPGGLQDIPIDPGISEVLAWIARAQDHSLSADGGVARHYCPVSRGLGKCSIG